MYIKYESKILYIHFHHSFKKLIAFSHFLFFFLIFKSSHYIYSSETLGLEVKQNVTLQNQCTFWYKFYLSKSFRVCDSNVSYHVSNYVEMDVFLVFTWVSENKNF